MAKRTYVPSLLNATVLLCKLIAKATPVITALFPSNQDLLDKLAAANTACSALSGALALVREFGD